MARIAGVDLSKNKRIEVALTSIYGIGRSTARKILEQVGVDFNTKSEKLSETELTKIREVVSQEYTTEGELRRGVSANIKRLMDLGCYRGLRHRKSLPARGQRTHTNARTRKGPRGAMRARRKQKSER